MLHCLNAWTDVHRHVSQAGKLFASIQSPNHLQPLPHLQLPRVVLSCIKLLLQGMRQPSTRLDRQVNSPTADESTLLAPPPAGPVMDPSPSAVSEAATAPPAAIVASEATSPAAVQAAASLELLESPHASAETRPDSEKSRRSHRPDTAAAQGALQSPVLSGTDRHTFCGRASTPGDSCLKWSYSCSMGFDKNPLFGSRQTHDNTCSAAHSMCMHTPLYCSLAQGTCVVAGQSTAWCAMSAEGSTVDIMGGIEQDLAEPPASPPHSPQPPKTQSPVEQFAQEVRKKAKWGPAVDVNVRGLMASAALAGQPVHIQLKNKEPVYLQGQLLHCSKNLQITPDFLLHKEPCLTAASLLRLACQITLLQVDKGNVLQPVQLSIFVLHTFHSCRDNNKQLHGMILPEVP